MKPKTREVVSPLLNKIIEKIFYSLQNYVKAMNQHAKKSKMVLGLNYYVWNSRLNVIKDFVFKGKAKAKYINFYTKSKATTKDFAVKTEAETKAIVLCPRRQDRVLADTSMLKSA